MATKLNQYHIDLPQGTRGERPTGAEGRIRYNTTSKQVEAYYNNDNTDMWAGLGQMTLISRLKTTAQWGTVSVTWDPNVHRYHLYRVDLLTMDSTSNYGRIYCRLHDNNSAPESGNVYAYAQQWWSANDGYDGCDVNFNRSSYWSVIGDGDSSNSSYGNQANGESYVMSTMFIGGGMPMNTTMNCWQMLGTSSYRAGNGDSGAVHTGDFIPSTYVTGENGQRYYNIRGITFGSQTRDVRGRSGVSTTIMVYGMHGFEEREA